MKTKRVLKALAVVLALGLSASDGSQALGGSATETPFMSVDEIRPGMKGKGKTVFQGARIEEFDVEILGILRDWRPGGDLILARASGPVLEYTGIAAGMSGTPIYVDGKLIGALAYSWPFSKEPIAGITPIGEMLEVGRSSRGSGGGKSGEIRWEDAAASGGTLREIGTPVLVSGFHPAVLDLMRRKLSGFNVLVAQTGGPSEGMGETLQPGSPLAAQLVSGDGTIAAIGTVTLARGRSILGFGHGLFLGGPVEIPMGSAFIHTVLPSISGSFKFGSASEIVGTITSDGPAGVEGEVGRMPRLIPVDVRVRTEEGERGSFHFDVMRSTLLTPSLVAWSVSSAVLTGGGVRTESTVGLKGEITLVDARGAIRKLTHRDLLVTTSPAVEIARAVAGPLELVLGNPYEQVNIEQITWDVRIDYEQRSAVIEEVYAASQEVEPGDSLWLTVRLRPFRGEPFTERVAVPIPATCGAAALHIKVCSSPLVRKWEEESTNRRLPPSSFEQLLTQIESSGFGNRIELVAYAELEGAGIEGRAFPSAPASFAAVIRNASRAASLVETPFTPVAAASLDTGYVVRGCKTITVRVKREGNRE
ncbi:MAG: SpoIVB peptidase S55 domain-containing protein [Candidatus Eisenbacteria bacterium]